MGGSLALALGSYLIMSFGIFLNTMNRLALRKFNAPAIVIYLSNAVAYGLAAPMIIWIVYRCVVAATPKAPGYGGGYVDVTGGIYLLALLGPPLIGGFLGTILTNSDYDKRLRGKDHFIGLVFSLITYVVTLCLVAMQFQKYWY
jgi:hypothetical protein